MTGKHLIEPLPAPTEVLHPTQEKALGENSELLARLCNLPPLNAIANQVLALSADPDASVEKLSATMQCDPAIAADVLLLANSSLFGFRSRIQVMHHAIALLGLERIKTVAFTAAMRSFVGGGGGRFLRPCWLHSVASAIIAEEICAHFAVKRDVVYPLSLIHDIGRLGLLKSNGKEYSPILSKRFDNAGHLRSTEREFFKVDHAVAGGWLVRTWGYPSIFVQVCENHHEPIDKDDSDLLQVVKISCRIAEALGFAAVSYSESAAYRDLIQSLPSFIPRKAFPAGADMAAMVEGRLKSIA